MTVLLPTTHKQKIKQKIQPLLLQPPTTPLHIEFAESSYIVKFTRRESGRFWRESMSALACWFLLGVAVKPNAFRTGDISYEAQRLRKLRQKDIAVPRLLMEGPNYIVMEHCGERLEPMLRCEQTRDELLPHIMDSLLVLHEADQWHGGAQVRNLTIQNDTIFRVDFEEKTGDVLPLSLAQAYDLFLCFNSLTKYLNFDVELGEKLLTDYLLRRKEPRVYESLSKLLNFSLRLDKMFSLLGDNFKSRSDIKRTRYFSAVLSRSLNNYRVRS